MATSTARPSTTGTKAGVKTLTKVSKKIGPVSGGTPLDVDDEITVLVGRDEVEVKRLAVEPANHDPLPRHEALFLRAFQRAEDADLISSAPPTDMIRALSRSVAEDPKNVVGRIESGITTLSTDIADVTVLRALLSCFGVLPGDQPRGAATGGRPTQVPDPVEDLTIEEENFGLRALTFKDLDHLRRWCADGIARSLTRAKKRGRPQEIAATGTRRPISVSMVLIQFEDGTPSQWVPMASDGISRLSVCLAGVLGLVDKDPAIAAKAIMSTLIPTNALSSASKPHDLVRRMQRQHYKQVEQYVDHLTDDGPDEDGIRIRQFLILPADLYLLATNSEDDEPHAMESAMQGVVSDTHTGVDGWEPEDQARHTVIRALTKMLENDDISQTFYGLCTGRFEPDVVDEIHPSDNDVDDDKVLFRRGVTIMATLASAENYETLKQGLREFGGHRQLTVSQVVEYIAPLVCEPWGTNKPMTKAWNYGGPVLPDLRHTTLVPMHPADYLDLVDIAMDEKSDEDDIEAARHELALAGGTALLADAFLTTAVVGGSGGSKTRLDFRGAINVAIDALTQTEEGLTLLALAANAFNPSQNAEKSRLPAVDWGREDLIARDNANKPVPVTEKEIAALAAQGDPDHANNKGDDDSNDDSDEEPTEEEMLQILAAHLPSTTQSLLKEIEQVKALHDKTSASTGLSEEDVDAMHDALSTALKVIGKFQ